MQKIAFFAHKWHSIDFFEPVLDELKKRGIDFDVFIIYPRDDAYQKYSGKYEGKLIEPLQLNGWAKIFYEPYRLPIPSFLKPYTAYLAKTLYFQYLLAKMFRRRKYNTLVTSDDRALISCIALSAAKKTNLKTILYPVETITYIEDFLEDRLISAPKMTSKKRAMSLISKLIYPANTITYKERSLHHTPPRRVLQLFLLKIFPENPWVQGTNKHIDIAAVNSQIQKQLNCRARASEKKISVTGFPPHDTLYFHLKNKGKTRSEICRALNLPDKKIFLIMGTHHPANRDWVEDKDAVSYDQETNLALRKIINVLGDEYAYIFKVHPQRNLDEQKQTIANDLLPKVTFVKNEYSVYKLTAASDAVFNFMSSATIAAFATENPIFCYYLLRKSRLASNWHERFRSIVQVETPEKLQGALLSLKKNTFIGKDFKEKRLFDRNSYGRFDGKNTERFLKLLSSL